jgi:hypothetical protein
MGPILDSGNARQKWRTQITFIQLATESAMPSLMAYTAFARAYELGSF